MRRITQQLEKYGITFNGEEQVLKNKIRIYPANKLAIDVFDGESKYIMDICFLSGARTFMVDDMEIDDLKRYSWLFTRVSTLISEWRKDEELRQMIGANEDGK